MYTGGRDCSPRIYIITKAAGSMYIYDAWFAYLIP